jgi:hypothetical protein
MILAEGCFQDYTLFESIRGLLRKEFVLKQEYLSKDLTKLGRRLQDQETVALHVRAALDMSATGVRVGQPRSLKPQYYQWAVERVLARFPDAVFAVFRDSPSPVQFLPLGQMNLAYLGEGKRPAHEDFYLMTLCRHHIVANSTFSWWAAWLATQEAALVVSPPPHDYGYTIAVPANWNTAA